MFEKKNCKTIGIVALLLVSGCVAIQHSNVMVWDNSTYVIDNITFIFRTDNPYNISGLTNPNAKIVTFYHYPTITKQEITLTCNHEMLHIIVSNASDNYLTVREQHEIIYSIQNDTKLPICNKILSKIV